MRHTAVTVDRFLTHEVDIQTCPHKGLINQWACPTCGNESAQSRHHLPRLVFCLLSANSNPFKKFPFLYIESPHWGVCVGFPLYNLWLIARTGQQRASSNLFFISNQDGEAGKLSEMFIGSKCSCSKHRLTTLCLPSRQTTTIISDPFYIIIYYRGQNFGSQWPHKAVPFRDRWRVWHLVPLPLTQTSARRFSSSHDTKVISGAESL